MRRGYQTDLNDREWLRINKFFEVSYAKGGRPIQHSKKEILNTIFYILHTRCQWRYLSHDFPPWKIVYTYFRNWKQAGIFEKINDMLIKQARSKIGKNEKPSAYSRQSIC